MFSDISAVGATLMIDCPERPPQKDLNLCVDSILPDYHSV